MGQVINAEVRINVNDDQAAPDNSTIENFTATFATTQGRFTALPASCLETGVDPGSSISADGSTLVCNFGTQDEGTALALQVPIEVTGAGGSQLTFDGSVGDVSAPQLTHDIVSNFMMDLSISQPSALQTGTDDMRSMQFEYSLSWGKDSEAGPDSVSYVLTATPTTGTVSNVSACAAFTDQQPSGHPNSGAGSPPERTAPFADCTITRIGTTNQFTLTLNNIDYSLAQVPTETSGGDRLPTDRSVVASGKFVVAVLAADGGSVALSVDAPTYESVDGNTSIDDPSNNTSGKAWANRGLWVSSWNRGFTGSGGGPFDDTYRVAPGTVVRSSTYFDQRAQTLPLTDTQTLGLCTILDNKYVDFAGALVQSMPGAAVPAGAAFQWYVGSTQAVLDPDSTTYNPGSLNNCGSLTSGSWVDTQPTDLASIQAVRVNIPFGSAKQYVTNQILVEQTIQADAPIGMDVWQFSSYFIPGTGWAPANANSGVITPTPDARHTHTNGNRDILRIVGVTPLVEKTVDSTVLNLGAPATYTLTYSANGGAAAPETVDGYQIVDQLPVGLTYVEGSAEPAPTVTIVDGAQVLTWNLDGVATNTVHTITYEAVANEDAVPGQRLENTAGASVQGQTSRESVATVTITTDGRTIIGKSADQQFIPNVDGNGNGAGSWTVTLRSEDPTSQSFTDVIDILPYLGDERGTSFSGTYALTGVVVTGAETVYYTTTDPADLTDDPADPANGSAGDVAGNTVSWSATAPADLSSVTAVRVIGGELAPSAVRSFQINIETQGAEGGDVYVNRAQGRAEHTELVMRTSAPTTVSAFYAYDLKKYVLGADGEWHDAQDENEADWALLPTDSEAQYKFIVTNTGQGDLTDIVVSDPLLGVEWVIDSLPTGESVESESYSYDLTGTESDPLRNEACAVAPLPADATQAELAEVCDEANIRVGAFTVSKTSDPASGTAVVVGRVVTYTVEVIHTGEADVLASFEDTLTEVLDDADYNGDVTASAGIATIEGDLLSWNGALEKGDVVTVTYSVTVTGAGDSVLTNVVLPGDGGVCVIDAECTTTHREGAYTVSKTSDPASGTTVAVGGVVTYTVEVTHTGEADVDASFEDTLTEVLDDADYNGDVTASAGTATIEGDALSWNGLLKKGDVVTVTYSVTVVKGGDGVLANVVLPGKTGSCVPAPDQNADCKTNHEIGAYTVSKTSDPASETAVAVGDVVTYTVEVIHTGEADVLASFEDTLTEVLDDADYNGDVTASAGTATIEGDALSWNGLLKKGDVVTVTYSVTVTGAGDSVLTNVVLPGEGGSCVPAPDQNADCTTTHPIGAFTVSKTSDPASGTTVAVGDVVTYTVEVTQLGEADVDASFEDTLTEVLDDADYNGDVTASAGTATIEGDALSWNGLLKKGDVVTVTYSVTVTGAGDSVLTNVVLPTSPNGVCVPAPDENADCTTTHPMGAFTVSKTSDPASGTTVAVGDVVTYTVEVTHTGEADVDASFEDTLTEVLDDADYNGDVTASAGAAAVGGDVLTWNGLLKKGDVVTVTYSVTVVKAGDGVLTNVVLPTSPNGVCVPAPDKNADCTTTHDKKPKDLAVTGMGSVAIPVSAGLALLLIGGAFLLWKRRREVAEIE